MLEKIALPLNAEFFGRPFFPFADNRLNALNRVGKRDQQVDMIRHQQTEVYTPNGGSNMEDQATADRLTSEPPGNQIPFGCPECNGPLYEVKDDELAHFQCFVGHRFSPEGLSEQHTEALERALWTAVRKLKERVVLHKELVERRKRNKGENELLKRLKESVATAESDLKLLREVLERI
jgi:hypothetical protein